MYAAYVPGALPCAGPLPSPLKFWKAALSASLPSLLGSLQRVHPRQGTVKVQKATTAFPAVTWSSLPSVLLPPGPGDLSLPRGWL